MAPRTGKKEHVQEAESTPFDDLGSCVVISLFKMNNFLHCLAEHR